MPETSPRAAHSASTHANRIDSVFHKPPATIAPLRSTTYFTDVQISNGPSLIMMIVLSPSKWSYRRSGRMGNRRRPRLIAKDPKGGAARIITIYPSRKCNTFLRTAFPFAFPLKRARVVNLTAVIRAVKNIKTPAAGVCESVVANAWRTCNNNWNPGPFRLILACC